MPEGKSTSDIAEQLIYFKTTENPNGIQKGTAGKLSPFALPFQIESQKSFDISRSTKIKGAQAKRISTDKLYKIELPKGDNVIDRINELLKFDNVVYAEPVFREELLYIPNDPQADPNSGAQTYLSTIKAYDAWDISQGSETIIVGISDTGLDLDHPEIINKLHPNSDGSFGYDFADEDTDAQADFSPHGTRVGGFVGAEADNEEGIAGIGFNTRIVPLKVFPSDNIYAINAYESILAAADSGYHIINLSWGSASTFSQANQDIINYAVEEKDIVVVAAAGNSNKDEPFYPAAYENVLSVAATGLNDVKANFSTYHWSVDVSAPGNLVYGTTNNGYGSFSGTSFASPIVAGVAALVRAYHPELNAKQVMERIRATADDIESVNDASLAGKLGKGRLNAFRALDENGIRSVRIEDLNIYGSNGTKFYYDDSIFLDFQITNFFDSLKSGSLKLSGNEGYIVFPEINDLTLGELEGQSFTRYSGKISESVSPGSAIDLALHITGDSYEDFHRYTIQIESDEFLLENGALTQDVHGNGSLARSSELLSGEETFASEIGLIISTSETQVSDNAPDNFGTDGNSDFSTEQFIKPLQNSTADKYSFSIFKDSNIGLKIEQSTLEWDEIDNAFAISYRIINTSSESIPNLNFGMFVDWDLQNSSENYCSWDNLKTAFAKNSDGSIVTGLRILSDGVVLHSALDIQSFNGNSAEFSGAFSDSRKHQYLATESIDAAGTAGAGNDIAQILGSSLGSFEAYESKSVTFLFGHSSSTTELFETFDGIESLYQEFVNAPPLSDTFFSCENGTTDINPAGGVNFNFYSDPFGGTLVGSGESVSFGPVDADSALYVANMDSLYLGPIRKVDITFRGQIADFEMSADTVFTGEETVINFDNRSIIANTFEWDFGNGLQSKVSDPIVPFISPGVYNITLSATSEDGCNGQVTKELYVLERPEKLHPKPVYMCFDEDLLLKNDTTSFRLYEEVSNNLIYEGSSFSLKNLQTDTSFLISNYKNGLESDLEQLIVYVSQNEASYEMTPHLSNLLENEILLFQSTTDNLQSVNWTINDVDHGQDSIILSASEEQFNITLSVKDSGGCTSSATASLSFAPSPKPVIFLPDNICPSDTLIIGPANGKYFGFYNSPELDSAMHKGERIILAPGNIPDTLWIVGLDNGLPGESLEVHIEKQGTELSINAEPPTLNLSQANSAKFTIGTDSALWFLDGEFQGFGSESIFSFPDAGSYQIKAQLIENSGCVISKTLDFEVILEAEEVLGIEDELNRISIYPNPAQSDVSIESPERIRQCSIADFTGRLLKTIKINSNSFQIKLSDLPTGIYLLLFISEDEEITVKKISKL